jgi:hypothetical protein
MAPTQLTTGAMSSPMAGTRSRQFANRQFGAMPGLRKAERLKWASCRHPSKPSLNGSNLVLRSLGMPMSAVGFKSEAGIATTGPIST